VKKRRMEDEEESLGDKRTSSVYGWDFCARRNEFGEIGSMAVS